MIEKLAELHKVDADNMKKHVSKTRFDSISSQYNMLMDHYSQIRRGKSVFYLVLSAFYLALSLI